MKTIARRCGLMLGALSLVTKAASASSALEYPDNGVAQFSRGGAWLATATDPIAGFYNPAALATQPTSFGVGMNLPFQKICYERRGPDNQRLGPTSGYTARKEFYPEVCNSNAGQPNAIPNVAFSWRASEKLALGLTIVPPSAYGLLEWPDLVPADQSEKAQGAPRRTEPIPAPQRYLSLYTKGTILFPTLSVGYSLTDQLHVGAGFVAGIALLEFRSVSMGTVSATNPLDDFSTDSRSVVKAKDLFVPGAVASVLFEATPHLDLAGWYRVSDKIRAEGDLEVVAPYYDPSASKYRTKCDYAGQSQDEPSSNCAEIVDAKNAAKIELTLPMEARIGARWHMARRDRLSPVAREKLRQDAYRTRDPLRDDLYDVELDLTWAKNSDASETKVRFDDNIFVAGLGTVPTNADRPTGWKDTFGVRLGMQYNLLRNLMGLRAGGWLETSAVDDEYLSVTGVPSLRGGVGGGVVLRIQSVDVEAGYQHIESASLDNGGDGKLRAIASTGSADRRSYHSVNGGKVSQHANVLSLGVVSRF